MASFTGAMDPSRAFMKDTKRVVVKVLFSNSMLPYLSLPFSGNAQGSDRHFLSVNMVDHTI